MTPVWCPCPTPVCANRAVPSGRTCVRRRRHLGSSPACCEPWACSPSSSTGASARCRLCPAGPAGPALSRRSGSFATWWPPWRRLCRSCPPASGAHSRATSNVSVTRPAGGVGSRAGSGTSIADRFLFSSFFFAASSLFPPVPSIVALRAHSHLPRHRAAPAPARPPCGMLPGPRLGTGYRDSSRARKHN